MQELTVKQNLFHCWSACFFLKNHDKIELVKAAVIFTDQQQQQHDRDNVDFSKIQTHFGKDQDECQTKDVSLAQSLKPEAESKFFPKPFDFSLRLALQMESYRKIVVVSEFLH